MLNLLLCIQIQTTAGCQRAADGAWCLYAAIYTKKLEWSRVAHNVSLRCLFVCVEVLRPSQPNGVMSNAVSLPNHTFTGQA